MLLNCSLDHLGEISENNLIYSSASGSEGDMHSLKGNSKESMDLVGEENPEINDTHSRSPV